MAVDVLVGVVSLAVGLLLGKQWGLWMARRILREEATQARRTIR